jgi:hypothetical protein
MAQRLKTLGAMTAAALKTIIAPMIGKDDLADAIGYAITPAGFATSSAASTGPTTPRPRASPTRSLADVAAGASCHEPDQASVCARPSSGDSVKLPAATAGVKLVVVNSAAANGSGCVPGNGRCDQRPRREHGRTACRNTIMYFECAVAGTWNVTVPQPDAKYTTRALSSSTAAAGELTGAKFRHDEQLGREPRQLHHAHGRADDRRRLLPGRRHLQPAHRQRAGHGHAHGGRPATAT